MTAPPNSTASKYLAVPFQQLLDKRAFAAIEEALYKETNEEALCLWLEEDALCRNDGETPLHRVAASHQPPVSLVEFLLFRVATFYGDQHHPLDATDAGGRTPLHWAVARTNVHLVPLLAHGSLDAASTSTLVTAPLVLDAQRRSPLHWACMHSHQEVRHASPGLLRGWLKKVSCHDTTISRVGAVRLLLDVYPEAVHLRDVNGYTPLDLALAHDADPLIVKLVHATVLQLQTDDTHRPVYHDASHESHVPRDDFVFEQYLDAEFSWGGPLKEVEPDDTVRTSSVHSASNGSRQSYKSKQSNVPYACVEM